MSQKGTRKSQNATVIGEDKEKRTDSPVKEMKKKMAANAEKEKQATEKTDKPAEKVEKPADKPNKPAEKIEKPADKSISKPAEKNDKSTKPAEKPADKQDKSDKNAEKQDKNAEKQDKNEKTDKPADKKQEKSDKKPEQKPAEKPQEKKDDNKGDKNAKEKQSKVNGHNGAEANGTEHSTVSDDSSDDLIIEEDELFPELTYDDSDTEPFEADAGRSLTRRSQVKVTKTPETPRPTSDKDTDDSKESKVLKLSDTPTSDRKLRSADSPKPDARKTEQKTDNQKKTEKASEQTEGQEEKADSTKKDTEGTNAENKLDMDAVVEIESNEGEIRNKCRARVSPYSRPKHDVTVSSVTANYTGNNTTMEMDITETSIVEDNADDSGYLRGLRNIRARTSYKSLPHLPPRRPARSAPATPLLLEARPTGCVVGRKRKPSAEEQEHVELADEATDSLYHSVPKRIKLFDRLAVPWRKNMISRRAAEIVGINTDLPLTAPVASALDPETIKPALGQDAPPPAAPLPTPDRDGKRCVVM